MKIQSYVISINSESNARRKVVEKNLETAGIKFNFFDATNGAEIDSRWIDENVSLERKEMFYSGDYSWLTKGQLGCADSHRRLAQQLIESDQDAYLVFEDDVVPDPKFFSHVLLSECLNKHDLVLLNHSSIERRLPGKTIDLSAGYSIRRYPKKGCLNASAYLISKAAAKVIVAHQCPKISAGADNWSPFFAGQEERCAIVWPRAASTGLFDSSIRETSFIRRALMRLLRLSPLGRLYYARQRKQI